jgi:hypothetical protein
MDTMETAHRLRGILDATGLRQKINEALNALDDSDSVNDLRLCLASGVGFHNADLTYPERSLVEDGFRSGEIRALVATTTIAMGVNLPCDVVIVGDTTRYVPRRGSWSLQNVSVTEYRNASGRAGRLGQRTAGYAVLIAATAPAQRQLVNAYLLGRVEPVESQIPKRPFADVVFGLVCSEVAHDEDGIVNFVAATFAYLTFYEREGGGFRKMRDAVKDAVKQCVDSGLVVRDGSRLGSTQVGRVLAGAGLSLASSARFASVLEHAITNHPSRKDLIFEIASCKEVGDRPWLLRRRGAEVDPRPRHVPDGAGSAPGSRLTTALAKSTLVVDEACALVRAKCLLEWGAALAEITDSGAIGASWLFRESRGVACDRVAGAGCLRRQAACGVVVLVAALAGWPGSRMGKATAAILCGVYSHEERRRWPWTPAWHKQVPGAGQPGRFRRRIWRTPCSTGCASRWSR